MLFFVIYDYFQKVVYSFITINFLPFLFLIHLNTVFVDGWIFVNIRFNLISMQFQNFDITNLYFEEGKQIQYDII